MQRKAAHGSLWCRRIKQCMGINYEEIDILLAFLRDYVDRFKI